MSPIIKWTPMFDQFEDMDKMFHDFLPAVQRGQQKFMPAIDMYEEKDAVVIETELAGIDPEQVTISIENDTVIIKGESEKKTEVDDKNYYKKEIRRGSFFRSIQLPAHVLGDQAKATAEDGVLKISVPKAPEGKPLNIKIDTKKNK
jgi:HSP20 family protein